MTVETFLGSTGAMKGLFLSILQSREYKRSLVRLAQFERKNLCMDTERSTAIPMLAVSNEKKYAPIALFPVVYLLFLVVIKFADCWHCSPRGLKQSSHAAISLFSSDNWKTSRGLSCLGRQVVFERDRKTSRNNPSTVTDVFSAEPVTG